MHAKPDLRFVLKWKIAGSGSVIADVRLSLSPLVFSVRKILPREICDDSRNLDQFRI